MTLHPLEAFVFLLQAEAGQQQLANGTTTVVECLDLITNEKREATLRLTPDFTLRHKQYDCVARIVSGQNHHFELFSIRYKNALVLHSHESIPATIY